MSSSTDDDDDHCDFARLLQDIREALGASTYPGIYHDPATPQEANITDLVYSHEESNTLNEWQDGNLFIMNEKDKQLIEEQIRILQQIERYKKTSSTNIKQDDPSIPSRDEDSNLKSSESDQIDLPELKLPEWEGKLIDEIDHDGSRSVSSLGASDLSNEDVDYNKLLRDIQEAVGTTTYSTLIHPTASLMPHETNMKEPPPAANHPVYNNTTPWHDDDMNFILDDTDELLWIEEQFRILQEIQKRQKPPSQKSTPSKEEEETK